MLKSFSTDMSQLSPWFLRPSIVDSSSMNDESWNLGVKDNMVINKDLYPTLFALIAYIITRLGAKITCDAWTVRVVKADIRASDGLKQWPAVINSKYLNSAYQNKGAASKQYETTNGKYFYDVVFGTFEMHGRGERQLSIYCAGDVLFHVEHFYSLNLRKRFSPRGPPKHTQHTKPSKRLPAPPNSLLGGKVASATKRRLVSRQNLLSSLQIKPLTPILSHH